MVRSVVRTRAFPILGWAYVVAIGVQVFFAGMFVFVGASNIELHRTMAHVIGLTQGLLILAVFVGRVPERRAVFGLLGLLVLQGMLVHVNQWFGLSMVAALHPVNALVLTGVAYALARRSLAYWTEPRTDAVAAAPSTAVPSAA